MARTYRKSRWQIAQSRAAYENHLRSDLGHRWYHTESRISDALAYYDKQTRDSASRHEGTAKKQYRYYTNKLIRKENRKDLKKIIDDPDSFDNMTFADKYSAKYIAWNIW